MGRSRINQQSPERGGGPHPALPLSESDTQVHPLCLWLPRPLAGPDSWGGAGPSLCLCQPSP